MRKACAARSRTCARGRSSTSPSRRMSGRTGWRASAGCGGPARPTSRGSRARPTEAVELIARERARGGRLWVESCPQYFFLLEEDVLRHGPFRKFTPPARLGSAEGAAEMWRLLTDGAISHLSTDHAPATRGQKQGGDIWQAPFGLPGVETTLTLLLHAVHHGWVALERV